jgi:hypothetical protein
VQRYKSGEITAAGSATRERLCASLSVEAVGAQLRHRGGQGASCRPRAAGGRPLAGLEVVEKLLTSKPSPSCVVAGDA